MSVLSKRIILITSIIVVAVCALFAGFIYTYYSAANARNVSQAANELDGIAAEFKDVFLANTILGQDRAIGLLVEEMRNSRGLESVEWVCGYSNKGASALAPSRLVRDGILQMSYRYPLSSSETCQLILDKRVSAGVSHVEYRPKMYTLFAFAVLLLILIFLGVTFTMKKYFSTPLKEVFGAIEQLADEKYEVQVPSRKGEFRDVILKLKRLGRVIEEGKDELAKQSRLVTIGRTSAMIAHDIRKPFAQMKSLINMMPEKKDDPEFVRYASSQVNDSIRRTESMLTDILEYSRDAKIDTAEVGIQGMITSALGEVFKNAGDVDVSINYLWNHKRCVDVDEIKVARVFANVIDNAVSAMRGAGKIWIETREFKKGGGNWVEVMIANNGPRIDEVDCKRIFEPFFTKGKGRGTGLGLSICQKIVAAHGGDIKVESSHERTEFSISLPTGRACACFDEGRLIRHSNDVWQLAHQGGAQRNSSVDAEPFLQMHRRRGGESCLLIVDDEPLFRETMRSLINRIPEVRDKLKVVEADSGELALKQFEVREFDYVISDIDMGSCNMDGYEFVKEVLDKYPRTMVLMHSNKRVHGKDDALMGRKNFQGFLPKPMSEADLLHFLGGRTFNISRSGVVENSRGKKVLVVNDEDFMRVAMKFSLNKIDGVQILEAEGVSDALRMLRDEPIDVIFADINLGEERDGYDILREAKNGGNGGGRDIKCYMMSGMPREEAWPRARDLGADGYIQLPYEEEDLRKILFQ